MPAPNFRLIIKSVLIIIFVTVVTNAASAQAFYSNYPFRFTMTANNSVLGTTTDQTNFVLLLKVVSPNLVPSSGCGTSVSPSSSVPDFAIVSTLSGDSPTTELHYQVESYNPSTGTIYFWVNTPTLKSTSSGINNTYYCYFGSPSPPIAHTTLWQEETWSNVTSVANVNYTGVWHFNETPVAAISTSSKFYDATVNGNTLSQGTTSSTTGYGLTQNTASQIGNGITLNHTSVLDIGLVNAANCNASQTLSIWASYPALSSTTANLIVVENSANPGSSGDANQLGISYGTTTQLWRWANQSTPIVSSTPAPSINTWHHFVYSYNATNTTSVLYVDGVAKSTNTGLIVPQSGTINMVAFGDYIANSGTSHVGGGEVYTGTMDESHLIGACLSADWIKAEYQNQLNPSTFTTVGALQTDPTNSAATPGYLSYQWKGTSTDITNANNWNNTTSGVNNQAPASSVVNWTIPAGLSNYPILTADASVYGLTLASGASINLNGHTLNVGCNVYNSGTITYNTLNDASALNFNGSISSQSYNGTATTGSGAVGTLAIANTSTSPTGTITISGNLDVYNQLTMTSGNLTVNNAATIPGVLTLKSNASQTAYVSAIPSGSVVSGNLNAERYITGGSSSYRGYRLMSNPLNISSNTSGSGYLGLSYINTTVGANHGALTGGPGGTTNGFTVSNNFPTLYLYQEGNSTNNKTYVSGKNVGIVAVGASTVSTLSGTITTSGVSIPVGNGYLFYFIGDNSVNTVTSNRTVQNTTVTAIGALNQGSIPVTIWSNSSTSLSYTSGTGASVAGLNQMGNPYASTITLDQVYADNGNGTTISPNFYELAEPGVAYYAYNASAHTSNNTKAGKYIVSGQGFYTQATGTGQTFTFKEDQKVSNQLTGASTPPLLLSIKKGMEDKINKGPIINALLPTPATANAGLHLQLTLDSITNTQTGIYFSNAWNDKYSVFEDAIDLDGVHPSVFLSSYTADGSRVTINEMGDYIKGKRVKLFVNARKSGPYQLGLADIRNIDTIYSVLLVDKLLKDSLDLRKNKTYSFNINTSDTTTFGSNRFELAIALKSLAPYRLLSFTGQTVSNGIQLLWNTLNEGDYTGFTLEKLSGSQFIPLYSLQGNGSSAYNYIDTRPASGINTYRLMQNDINGQGTYSDTVTINYNFLSSNGVLSVFPNPTRTNLNIYLNLPTGNYNLSIYNAVGMLMQQQHLSGNYWTKDITTYNAGTYIMEMTDTKGDFIGKIKFVKLK